MTVVSTGDEIYLSRCGLSSRFFKKCVHPSHFGDKSKYFVRVSKGFIKVQSGDPSSSTSKVSHIPILLDYFVPGERDNRRCCELITL